MTDQRQAVLVVDDEDGVRAVLAAMVARLGYAPLSAACGAEAVALCRAHWPGVAAAVMDVQMPELDGPATLGALRALAPTLPCVFVSGDLGPHTAAGLLAVGAVAVLDKPFALGRLGDALAAAVGRPAGEAARRSRAENSPCSGAPLG